MTEDATGIWLANELNEELRDEIPDGCTVVLELESPILKVRKVKRTKLSHIIRRNTGIGKEIRRKVFYVRRCCKWLASAQ